MRMCRQRRPEEEGEGEQGMQERDGQKGRQANQPGCSRESGRVAIPACVAAVSVERTVHSSTATPQTCRQYCIFCTLLVCSRMVQPPLWRVNIRSDF